MSKRFTLLLALCYSTICFGQQLQIDHVVTVVSDLEKSVQDYSDKGFTVKMGRLHDNGLHNAHIKFRNESSYELMTIKGKPKDEIAKTYAALLNEKGGGVYIALSGMRSEDMATRLDQENIGYKLFEGSNWNYIVFDDKVLSQFFFIDYKVKSSDSPGITFHKNKSNGIKEVSTTGSAFTFNFLEAFFGQGSSIESDTSGTGIKYKSTTGDILVFKNDLTNHHRLLSIEFDTNSSTSKLIITY